MSDLLRRIYELTERDGIKPTQLLNKLKLSSSSFSDWDKGKGSPSLKAVMKFSEYFGVSIDYLVYGKEKEPETSHLLEFSNQEDDDLLNKFHKLPPEFRQKAVSYIEGMLSALPKQSTKEEQRKLLG